MITIPVIIASQLFIIILQIIIAVNAYVKNNYLLACIAIFGLGLSFLAIIDMFMTINDIYNFYESLNN
jgi:hypothetical protein